MSAPNRHIPKARMTICAYPRIVELIIPAGSLLIELRDIPNERSFLFAVSTSVSAPTHTSHTPASPYARLPQAGAGVEHPRGKLPDGGVGHFQQAVAGGTSVSANTDTSPHARIATCALTAGCRAS